MTSTRAVAGRSASGSLQRFLDRSLGGVTLVAAAGLLIALFAGGVRLGLLEPRLESLSSAQQDLARANQGMLDQETGLRAFLATADRRFLQPDATGQTELATAMERLTVHASGDPATVSMLLRLRTAQQAWESGWAGPARTGRPPPDLAAFLISGKQLFDSYRAAKEGMDQLLGAQLAATLGNARALGVGVVGLECIVLAVMLLVWLRTRRHLQGRVLGPVGDLLGILDLVRAGRLTVDSRLRGPAEFVALGERLGQVVDSLRRDREQLLQGQLEIAATNQRLRLLVETSRNIAGSLSLRYVVQAVGESVTRLGAARGVVWLVREAAVNELQAAFDSGGPHGRPVGLTAVEIGSGVVGKAAKYGRWVSGSDDSLGGAALQVTALPMVVGARVVGVLELVAPPDLPDGFGDGLLELFDTLASQAATAVEAARLYEDADVRSRTDALTSLGNRRSFDVELSRLIGHSQRYGRTLALAMLDVDHFKQYNDRHGHQAGDGALQELAGLLAARLRETDGVFRYGGEELAVLLPETEAEDAVAMVDRLRAAVEQRFTQLAALAPVTLSAGVAVFPTHALSAKTLIEAADAALYRAKNSGRNRVCAAAPAAIRAIGE